VRTLWVQIGKHEPFADGFAGGARIIGPTLCYLAQRDPSNLDRRRENVDVDTTFPEQIGLWVPPELQAEATQLESELSQRYPDLRVSHSPTLPNDCLALLVHAISPIEVASLLTQCDSLIHISLRPGGKPVIKTVQGRTAGRHLTTSSPTTPPPPKTSPPTTPPPTTPPPTQTKISAYPKASGCGPLQVNAPSASYDLKHDIPSIHLDTALADVGLIGKAPEFLNVAEQCEMIAPHDVPVLLQGETGTGKELFARLLHRLSHVSDGPFVSVNCGALPEKLVESTLFGHRKGSFTGAIANQTGRFSEADGGTLFLDEIGELPLEHQPKLLRVLQEGILRPVGDNQEHRVQVRVVAATHQPLERMVADGRFREDLYYRLAYGVVKLPPLRARQEDIIDLSLHFLDHINQGLAEARQFSTDALRRLEGHSWPGNIRDLQSVVGRSALWCSGQTIGVDDLQFGTGLHKSATGEPTLEEGFSLDEYLNRIKRRLILKALDQCGQNKSAAARLLGMSPQAISKYTSRDD